METEARIATEIIQLFPARRAWEYRLVPYRRESRLYCYGETGREYEAIREEIYVLYGYEIEVEAVSKEELLKYLNIYYRKETIVQANTGSAGRDFFKQLVADAFTNYASDIHFEPYENKCRIRFRIDGKLIERYVLEKTQYASLVNQIKIAANLDISEKRLPQDGRIMYNDAGNKFDIRVSSLPAIYGEKIVLRLLTRHVELLDINNLGFTERQQTDYLNSVIRPHGLVLISGPTGSGKSTTLYATLIKLNNETNNILTIEDPVEYTLDGINQVQLKEEIGLTFSSALRTFLRQDPDIIMLGEIRDADTAQMAIRSSLTGHLILSTIHTNSAYGCVSRLMDMGVHPYLISNTLILCVAQRLVRLLCPHCKKGNEAVGCPECYYTGYKGRKAIYEVIPVDEAVRRAIREGKTNIDDLLEQKKTSTIKEAAGALLEKGETSKEEIWPILQSV